MLRANNNLTCGQSTNILLCVSYKLTNIQSIPTERLTCFLAPDLVTEIRVLAARNRKNISEVVTVAISEYLDRQRKKGASA
jgi:hypothetical protein